MHSLRHRLTAAVLALSHALVGLAGYALHELAPCGDRGCESRVAAVCSCGHVHDTPSQPERKASLSRDAAFSTADGHDPHQCSLCALLAKFKVGYDSFDAIAAASPVIHRHIDSHPVLEATAQLLLPPARGPPVSWG